MVLALVWCVGAGLWVGSWAILGLYLGVLGRGAAGRALGCVLGLVLVMGLPRTRDSLTQHVAAKREAPARRVREFVLLCAEPKGRVHKWAVVITSCSAV